jgi:hypothetical protein
MTVSEYVAQFHPPLCVYAKGKPWISYELGAHHNTYLTLDSLNVAILHHSHIPVPDPIIPLQDIFAFFKAEAVAAYEAEKQKKKEDEFDYLAYCYDTVQNYTFNSVTRTFSQFNGKGVNEIPAAHLVDQMHANLGFQVSVANLKTALNVVMREIRLKEIADLQINLSYDPTTYSEASQYIEYFLKFFGIEVSPENITMFRHWVWHVKRNVYGLPKGRYPLMLVLTGKGKIGKSSFIQRGLNNLLKGGIREMSIYALKEAKDNRAMLSSCFVMELPEMDSGDLAADELNELLKRVIEAEYITSRDHYSFDAGSSRSTAAFIGTTNRPLSEVVFDHTGMRRYWELTCTTDTAITNRLAESEELWEGLTLLFRSIDENNTNGFWDLTTETGQHIATMQAELVKKDLMELYLKEKDLIPVPTEALKNTDKVILKSWPAMFDDFVNWCEKGNYRLGRRTVASSHDFIEERHGKVFYKMGKEINIRCVSATSRAKNAEQQALL